MNIDRFVKTKVVCTLGPASNTEERLDAMIRAGMDIVRLNFSHGKHEQHQAVFDIVRKLSKKYDHQVSILCDIQGPKIRTGSIKEPFLVSVGDKIKVTPKEVIGTKECIQVRYDEMLKDLDKDDLIYINDGLITLRVEKKDSEYLYCVADSSGMISSHKGCNIPSGNLSVNVVTPKDVVDLEFIAKLNPEYLAASFVGSAEDIERVRAELKKHGNTDIKIIAKLERPVAMTNLDAILEATDGAMVARGDLGVEIPTWEVPTAQKTICHKCNVLGKPVIVATQMLESMTGNPRPTRAEANDVYNAVLDGADAVMLSGESSVGKYPVEAVTVMDKIIEQAEKHIPDRKSVDYLSQFQSYTETAAHGAYNFALEFEKLGWTGKVIVVTNPPSAYTARMVSKYRPPLDILAMTYDERTAHELNLLWGVRSVLDESLATCKSTEERVVKAVKIAISRKLLTTKDHVIVVMRSMLGKHVGSTVGLYNVAKLV